MNIRVFKSYFQMTQNATWPGSDAKRYVGATRHRPKDHFSGYKAGNAGTIFGSTNSAPVSDLPHLQVDRPMSQATPTTASTVPATACQVKPSRKTKRLMGNNSMGGREVSVVARPRGMV